MLNFLFLYFFKPNCSVVYQIIKFNIIIYLDNHIDIQIVNYIDKYINNDIDNYIDNYNNIYSRININSLFTYFFILLLALYMTYFLHHCTLNSYIISVISL